jgi:hypothetical protein
MDDGLCVMMIWCDELNKLELMWLRLSGRQSVSSYDRLDIHVRTAFFSFIPFNSRPEPICRGSSTASPTEERLITRVLAEGVGSAAAAVSLLA